MNTSYIYAGTRAKVLETNLLKETQVERLLSAKSVEEIHSALQNTFLASRLLKDGETNITEALDGFIREAKQIITSIAPNPELLDILWLKYDYHNLKTIIKGKRIGQSLDEISKNCFAAGKYSIETIIKAFDDNTLGHLHNHFAAAATKAEAASHVFEIDLAMNEFYFATIKSIAAGSKDPFITAYVTLLIDLFNIKAALRADALAGIDAKQVFVPGGTFTRNKLEDKRKVLDSLRRIGSEKDWTGAIADFEKTGDYTPLEKSADEYVSSFVKTQSAQVFSPAPLFSYFNTLKSNAQLIGAVIAAKRSGVSEKDLRTILRRVYT